MDGNGLNLKKFSHFFCQVLMSCLQKSPKSHYGLLPVIKFICYLPLSFTGAFCVSAKALSNDFSTELELIGK